MTKTNTIVSGAIRFLGVAAIAGFAVNLVHCAGNLPPAQTVGNPNTVINCSTVTDCQNATGIPTCTNLTTMTCHAPYSGATQNICFFRLKDTVSCMCVEGDIERCTQSGGAAGIMTCTKLNSTTTYWGTCGSL